MPERVAKLEIDAANHEKVCADRWGILIKLIAWGGTAALTVVLSVAGFGLKAIYTGQQRQLDMLQNVQVQVAQQDPGKR